MGNRGHKTHTEKKKKKKISSSAAPSDRLSTREEQSILLRGSASVVWLLCILFQLHSECQAPLNRAGSRSSWRQEQAPAGTEAGSHCGLAGRLLRAQGRPLPAAASTAPAGLAGCGCEALQKRSVQERWRLTLLARVPHFETLLQACSCSIAEEALVHLLHMG